MKAKVEAQVFYTLGKGDDEGATQAVKKVLAALCPKATLGRLTLTGGGCFLPSRERDLGFKCTLTLPRGTAQPDDTRKQVGPYAVKVEAC